MRSDWWLKITADRRDDENWLEYWQRKHDEKHGPACQCAWNRGQPSPLFPLDTVPEGKRIAAVVGHPAGQEVGA